MFIVYYVHDIITNVPYQPVDNPLHMHKFKCLQKYIHVQKHCINNIS